MSAIDAKYEKLGGTSGRLGPPLEPELTNPDGVGKRRQFRNGFIYFHPRLVYNDLNPASGAWSIERGPFWERWSSLRHERGVLGYPVEDQTRTPDGTGRRQAFEFGSIYWSSATGAHEIHGAIREKWRNLGAERSFLGYPVTNETATPDGEGRYNHFQGGSIYWIPYVGAHEVHGAILAKWRSVGWERSFLGYPVTDETSTPDGRGRYNHFQKGSVYWSPETGAHEIHGDIRDRWARTGWELGPLGYPTSDERSTPDGARVSAFEHGSITWRLDTAPLSFFAQNMALLPWPATYKGTERRRAMDALIEYIRVEQPDLVGLSEVFVDSERERIRRLVRTIYPYFLEGPDEADIESDGGLLLLSKYPFLVHGQTIYRQCGGVDCLANKGALHGRVAVPGHPVEYDIFLTHLQNPNEGGRESSRPEVRRQLDHLSAFIHASTLPGQPALLMGDLNTNGLNAAQHADLLSRLRQPLDLWLLSGDGTSGITDDKNTSFHDGEPARPADDPSRHHEGARIDYLLAWPSASFWPSYRETRVLVLQSSPGRDISDHYGIQGRQSDVRHLVVTVDREIRGVSAAVTGFRCLTETPGSGSDEVSFRLDCTTGTGQEAQVRTQQKGDVDSGDEHTFGSPRWVEVGDPGGWLRVSVSGSEHDDTSPDDGLGSGELVLSRAAILENLGRTWERVLPMLRGDGAEYAVSVALRAQ